MKYEIHNQHVTHQHIHGASKTTLQEQFDAIESKLLQSGGSLAVLQKLAGGNPYLKDASEAIGEAFSSLLKVKEMLGLESDLSESSHS